MEIQKLLDFFPEIQVPVTLREDTYEELSANKPPIPEDIIAYFLIDENEEDDGMTEYIPCFRLPNTKDFYALVYWKASLLNYQYILKTYTTDGTGVIDSVIIGGTVVEGDKLIQSIAMIDADNAIYIATGTSSDDYDFDDAATNTTRSIEINEDGTLDI